MPKVDEDQQHPEDEAEVADAVDDERLLAGVGGRLLPEPEADQQVRAETDAFPADEHHREVGAEHQHQHERGEQIQVREVARVLAVALLVHVAGRVDVDQRADAGDDQDHQRRQVIEPERKRDLQIAGRDPVEGGLLDARAPSWRQRSATTDSAETTNEPIIARQATPPETDFGSRRPRKALTRNPTNGNSGISSSSIASHHFSEVKASGLSVSR